MGHDTERSSKTGCAMLNNPYLKAQTEKGEQTLKDKKKSSTERLEEISVSSGKYLQFTSKYGAETIVFLSFN